MTNFPNRTHSSFTLLRESNHRENAQAEREIETIPPRPFTSASFIISRRSNLAPIYFYLCRSSLLLSSEESSLVLASFLAPDPRAVRNPAPNTDHASPRESTEFFLTLSSLSALRNRNSRRLLAERPSLEEIRVASSSDLPAFRFLRLEFRAVRDRYSVAVRSPRPYEFHLADREASTLESGQAFRQRHADFASGDVKPDRNSRWSSRTIEWSSSKFHPPATVRFGRDDT